MTRPIDLALAECRAAKRKVRELWLEEVQKYQEEGGALYLTLPGADGHDVEMLIEAGIVTKTETGAIAEEDQDKIIAVESNMEAILNLQRKFPGLKIRETRLENVISGGGMYAWPNEEIKKDLCAKVINIDSDKSLRAEVNGGVSFPLIQIVKKISQIHKDPPHQNPSQTWTLCLTINSTMNWPQQVVSHFFQYLGDNCANHADFDRAAAIVFGKELIDRMKNDPASIKLQELSKTQQHQLMCVFVPKLIITEINDHKWSLDCCKTLAYGGRNGQAPMTTIVMSFCASATLSPARRYEANLEKLLPGLGTIDDEGELSFELN